MNESEIRGQMHKYLPLPSEGHDHLVWSHASGASVWDVNGRRLIDFTSGVLVANTGHAHPRVVAAIRHQAGELLNCYDFPHPTKGLVAQRLVELAGPPFEKAALLTTGAEAIDAAVRAARAYTGRFEIASFAGGFHGRTIGAMSLSGLPGVRGGVGPLVPGTIILPLPSATNCPYASRRRGCGVQCFEQTLDVLTRNSTGSLAAFIVEPYLGAGGAHVPPDWFWQALRSTATELGALLILDEVQSSFGRTGSFYAFQGLEIDPDILVVAKGIASGIPMSAVLSRADVLDSLPPGSLGSTYGGNPLACAAAIATIDVILEEDLPGRALELGRLARQQMADWVQIAGVLEIRGLGLSLGIEFVHPETGHPDPVRAQAVLRAAATQGVVVLPPAGVDGNVIRLAPPLVIEADDLSAGLEALRRALLETVPGAAVIGAASA